MFDRILIPLDGSTLAECVISHALALARIDHPQIHLMRVVDPIGAETRPKTVDPFDWNFRKMEAESYLKEVAERFVEHGISPQLTVKEGKAAETVLEYAQEQQIDLIIVSSHGRSGITGWNVSSIVQKIILRARTSIMVIRAYQALESEAEVQYQRILLPLDGSQRAESAIQIATRLARAHNAEVVVAHVIQEPEMPRRITASAEDAELAKKVVERNRLVASNYLSDLKDRLDIKLETHLAVSSAVPSTLHKIAYDERVDLVLLTAHGLSGETNWPYGSVVTTFIAYGSTPLLVYQDMAPENIGLSDAEKAAKEYGEH